MTTKAATLAATAASDSRTVDLVDFINEESEKIVAVMGLMNCVCEALALDDPFERQREILEGFAVIVEDAQNRVHGVKDKAEKLWQAYLAAQKDGAR